MPSLIGYAKFYLLLIPTQPVGVFINRFFYSPAAPVGVLHQQAVSPLCIICIVINFMNHSVQFYHRAL